MRFMLVSRGVERTYLLWQNAAALMASQASDSHLASTKVAHRWPETLQGHLQDSAACRPLLHPAQIQQTVILYIQVMILLHLWLWSLDRCGLYLLW